MGSSSEPAALPPSACCVPPRAYHGCHEGCSDEEGDEEGEEGRQRDEGSDEGPSHEESHEEGQGVRRGLRAKPWGGFEEFVAADIVVCRCGYTPQGMARVDSRMGGL